VNQPLNVQFLYMERRRHERQKPVRLMLVGLIAGAIFLTLLYLKWPISL